MKPLAPHRPEPAGPPPELLPTPRVRSVDDSTIHMRSSLFAICLAVTAAASDRALNPTFESAAPLSALSPIDARVFDRLQRLRLPPPNPSPPPATLSSDAVFLRRAFLDIIGTLPTAQEASDFLADPAPAKRAALIDRLLDRPEFADYWAMKWCDLLG